MGSHNVYNAKNDIKICSPLPCRRTHFIIHTFILFIYRTFSDTAYFEWPTMICRVSFVWRSWRHFSRRIVRSRSLFSAYFWRELHDIGAYLTVRAKSRPDRAACAQQGWPIRFLVRLVLCLLSRDMHCCHVIVDCARHLHWNYFHGRIRR